MGMGLMIDALNVLQAVPYYEVAHRAKNAADLVVILEEEPTTFRGCS